MSQYSFNPDSDAAHVGQHMRGFGITLLTSSVPDHCCFARDILHVNIIREDSNFAIIHYNDNRHDDDQDFIWFVHDIETYKTNPLYGLTLDAKKQHVPLGVGMELRLYNRNPDDACLRAEQHGYTILSAAYDKPHGMREAIILDDDGYAWVLSCPLFDNL